MRFFRRVPSNAVGPQRSRELRTASTDAELKLWSMLRNRGLGGFKFRRQFPIGGYIADFVCIERKLIIEVDGFQHVEREQYDRQRTADLNARGFRVLRFWNNDVLENTDDVAEEILTAMVEG